MKTIDQIFENHQGGWGLRGDPQMWEDLRVQFRGQEANLTLADFNSTLQRKFYEIIRDNGETSEFQNQKTNLTPADYHKFLYRIFKEIMMSDEGVSSNGQFQQVYFKNYDQSGMSGGYISLDWWKEIGLPMLNERYSELINDQ